MARHATQCLTQAGKSARSRMSRSAIRSGRKTGGFFSRCCGHGVLKLPAPRAGRTPAVAARAAGADRGPAGRGGAAESGWRPTAARALVPGLRPSSGRGAAQREFGPGTSFLHQLLLPDHCADPCRGPCRGERACPRPVWAGRRPRAGPRMSRFYFPRGRRGVAAALRRGGAALDRLKRGPSPLVAYRKLFFS